MEKTVTELEAEIARYERLARAISDQEVRGRLKELRAEAEAQLALLRSHASLKTGRQTTD